MRQASVQMKIDPQASVNPHRIEDVLKVCSRSNSQSVVLGPQRHEEIDEFDSELVRFLTELPAPTEEALGAEQLDSL